MGHDSDDSKCPGGYLKHKSDLSWKQIEEAFLVEIVSNLSVCSRTSQDDHWNNDSAEQYNNKLTDG